MMVLRRLAVGRPRYFSLDLLLMTQPLAYLDGQFLPADEARLPLTDAGFVLGATVTEQLRTFGGRLFRVEDHLARLARSLNLIGLQPQESLDQMGAIVQRIAAEHFALIDPADDLGVVVFITPGDYPALSKGAPSRPRLGVHSFRLAFSLWADKYEQGAALRTTNVLQVPSTCWPAALKCRSRMHYWLADRQAEAAEPHARALLTDQDGHVIETATANVLMVRGDEGLISPPIDRVLPGISLAFVGELAADEGLVMRYADLVVDDLASADELLLTSTPFGLLPVVRFNGQPVGPGRPGPVFQRLLKVWSLRVGVDLAGQAKRFSRRDR
jgi:branched-chain amino acid aminotransferase